MPEYSPGSRSIRAPKWSSTATDGLAVGANGLFELEERNDTYNKNVWRVGNLNPNAQLTMLVIEGAPGNTVFDLNGNGTAPLISGRDSVLEGSGSLLPFGSERGYTFEPENLDDAFGVFPADLHVSVTYSNIVRLASDAVAKGDVWTTLKIQFGGPAGGLPIYDGQGAITFHFNADTDTFDFLAEPVPEPSSLSLMLGLGLFSAWRYRRSQRTSAHS